MTETEIAQIVESVDMYELACKTNRNAKMDSVESDAIAELDKHFKEIGAAGHDAGNEIAAFLKKTVNEEIYNAPDELLDELFERGTIGEFDDYYSEFTPIKNTLVAHEAAKGGNVDRSFLDVSFMTPTWKNRQIESDISFHDIRRNGWKSIALMSEYATAAFRNTMFADVFTAIDSAITSGAANYIAESGTRPTQASMDAMALYIQDLADGAYATGGQIVALSKYIQAASKLTGFVSDEMKNEVNRNGRLGVYDSVSMFPISSAKKLGSGELLIPDKRMFGIAGKIGTLDMKGNINVYQVEDPNKEVFHLMWKDFTYGYAFNDSSLKYMCKMVLA